MREGMSVLGGHGRGAGSANSSVGVPAKPDRLVRIARRNEPCDSFVFRDEFPYARMNILCVTDLSHEDFRRSCIKLATGIL